MAGLNRRLQQLERLYGPAIVEAPQEPAAGAIPWTTHDQLEFSAWARDRLGQLRRMLEATPNMPQWLDEVAEIERMDWLDKCPTCAAWPMETIGVNPDGCWRCGHCLALLGRLPPPDCRYYGHDRQPCQCGYSYVAELKELWWFDVLVDEARREQLRHFWDNGTDWNRCI